MLYCHICTAIYQDAIQRWEKVGALLTTTVLGIAHRKTSTSWPVTDWYEGKQRAFQSQGQERYCTTFIYTFF